MLLPLQGALLRMPITQGDALGCALVAPSGRIVQIIAQVILSGRIVYNYSASYPFGVHSIQLLRKLFFAYYQICYI